MKKIHSFIKIMKVLIMVLPVLIEALNLLKEDEPNTGKNNSILPK